MTNEFWGRLSFKTGKRFQEIKTFELKMIYTAKWRVLWGLIPFET